MAQQVGGEYLIKGDAPETEEGDSQGTGDEGTQPLSISVGAGDSGDSQDGQITAEIVQADHPSPGTTL